MYRLLQDSMPPSPYNNQQVELAQGAGLRVKGSNCTGNSWYNVGAKIVGVGPGYPTVDTKIIA